MVRLTAFRAAAPERPDGCNRRCAAKTPAAGSASASVAEAPARALSKSVGSPAASGQSQSGSAAVGGSIGLWRVGPSARFTADGAQGPPA